ncbi:hypothetical protein SEMRO_2497_G329360.1 [Seminavis robusta]|uniref:Uncharacterized protein n=1 Tax=Seminavis robusta TaxID=568900 RepID=A0A9N8F2U9_9STRA|nr:hypothetical protein SEMRO_2497_G329360.1 [Seminavis robusta]|eukprot:Sro2497_g329360.1 n/a (229) ;mRNA; r:13381-14067
MKEKLEKLFISTGCEPESWFRAACHVADLRNHTAREKLGYRTPKEFRDGNTPDISGLLRFQFWELVYYKDPDHGFPSKGGNEKLGRWMGRALNYGDTMCYWILTQDTKQLIVRSMVRSTNDIRPNVAFQDLLEAEKKADQERRDDPIFPIVIYEAGEEEIMIMATLKSRTPPKSSQQKISLTSLYGTNMSPGLAERLESEAELWIKLMKTTTGLNTVMENKMPLTTTS